MISRRMFCTSAAGVALGAGCAESQTASPVLRLTAPRAVHGMVALGDGSALMIGGCVADSCDVGPASATVDRFDPATKQIAVAGRLAAPRVGPAAVTLGDGKVLVAGGWSNGRSTEMVERFDSRSGRSERVGAMSAAQLCGAVALPDGRALLVGERTVEVFDPATGRLNTLSEGSPWRESSTATLLADGRVLIAGGGVHGPPTDAAFVIDPASGKASAVGKLSAPRRKHAAVRLRDGRVLIVGGSGEQDRQGKTRVMEVFDPASAAFSVVGDALDARFKIQDAAVALSDGRVLVAGGADTPELIDPATWRSRALPVSIGAMLNFSCAVQLSGGDVLVAGGYNERNINPVDRAWLIPKAMFA